MSDRTGVHYRELAKKSFNAELQRTCFAIAYKFNLNCVAVFGINVGSKFMFYMFEDEMHCRSAAPGPNS